MTLAVELERVFAMNAAWDDAAAALLKRDSQGFDQAMARFKSHTPPAKHQEAELGEISKTGKKKLRRALFEKQDGKCIYCDGQMALSGCGANMASFDHVLPESLGGATAKDNLVLACWQCNRLKGCMTPDQMRRLADKIEELQQITREGGLAKAPASNS